MLDIFSIFITDSQLLESLPQNHEMFINILI